MMYDELVKKIRHCATDPMHCLSCGEDKDGQCFKRLMTQAADAIEELEGKAKVLEKLAGKWCEAVPKWIPVTERLPEHGWYLAYCPTIKMEVLHFHSAEEVWSSERYYNIEVTHWMPLPEPPKEE